jgi:alpha-ketoglutarate-dependent taurine dioxygenase
MSELKIRDLTPAFGAEIEGLDPHAKLDDEACRLLRHTFDERGLLLFRGLDLDGDYQTYLAKMVIGDQGGATSDGSEAEAADAFYVSNKKQGGGAPYGRLLFHSDMMWAETPFQVLTLYAMEVEPPVVPTMFASATYAWQALGEDLQARVKALHALHMTGQQMRADGNEDELLQPIREHVQSATKPVAHPHPRTGRTILYVSQMMTREIVELPPEQSENLLKVLFARLYDPATLLQHEWRNGDLVMWDNFAIQHARFNVSLDGPVRTLRKVIAPKPSMAGGRPETPRFAKVG